MALAVEVRLPDRPLFYCLSSETEDGYIIQCNRKRGEGLCGRGSVMPGKNCHGIGDFNKENAGDAIIDKGS